MKPIKYSAILTILVFICTKAFSNELKNYFINEEYKSFTVEQNINSADAELKQSFIADGYREESACSPITEAQNEWREVNDSAQVRDSSEAEAVALCNHYIILKHLKPAKKNRFGEIPEKLSDLVTFWLNLIPIKSRKFFLQDLLLTSRLNECQSFYCTLWQPDASCDIEVIGENTNCKTEFGDRLVVNCQLEKCELEGSTTHAPNDDHQCQVEGRKFVFSVQYIGDFNDDGLLDIMIRVNWASLCGNAYGMKEFLVTKLTENGEVREIEVPWFNPAEGGN